MVEDMGYTGKELGIYAGGLAAAFCAAQFCSSIAWGKFSDMYGRKLAIILGTIGAALGMLVFGTSKTYTQALIGRIASGLLSGNVGVLKSFLTEITDETNRGTGFSYMSTAWSLGCILAPLAGGLLCRPAVKYPYAFSSSGFFGVFPYVLPCLLCTIFSLLSALMCFIFMIDSRKESMSNDRPLALSGKASFSTAPSTPPVSARLDNRGQRSVSKSAARAMAIEMKALDSKSMKVSPISTAEDARVVSKADSRARKPPSLSRRLKKVFGSDDASSQSPHYQKLELADSDDDELEAKTEDNVDHKLSAFDDDMTGATESKISLLPPKSTHLEASTDYESEEKKEHHQSDLNTMADQCDATPRSRKVLRKVSSKTVVYSYGDEDTCTCSLRALCCLRCGSHQRTTHESPQQSAEFSILHKQDSINSTISSSTDDLEADVAHSLNRQQQARGNRNVSKMMSMVLGKLTLGYSLPFASSFKISKDQTSSSNTKPPAKDNKSSAVKSSKYSYAHLTDADEAQDSTPHDIEGAETVRTGNTNGEEEDDTKSVLRQKTVLLAVGTYGMLAMGFMLLDETIPLFLKLDEGLGGMSFDSSEIGFLLSICGGAVLIFAYWGLPWLMTVYSKAFLYKASIVLLVPTVIGWPILAEMKLNLFQKWFGHSVNVIVTWILLSLIGVMRGVTAVVAFTVVTIQVNHSVYDRHLGLVNGLGQSLASLARACGPALGGALWSLSMSTQFVFLNFIVVALILVLSQVMSSHLPTWLEMKRQPKEIVDEMYVEEELYDEDDENQVMAFEDLHEEKDVPE